MKNPYENINEYLECPFYPTRYEFYYPTQASLNSKIGIVNLELFANEVDRNYKDTTMPGSKLN
jgi:hypothetical protein